MCLLRRPEARLGSARTSSGTGWPRLLSNFAGVQVSGERNLLRRGANLIAPRGERLAVAPLVYARPAQRNKNEPAGTAVRELSAKRRGDANQLALPGLEPFLLDDEREIPLQHQIDLLLALVAMDPSALSRLQHDLVHAKRTHAQRSAQR